MKPYGIKNKRFATIHSHNNCSICSNSIVSKKSARQSEKDEIEERLVDLLDWDGYDFGDLHWIESDSFPPCDCDYCMPDYEESGNGWMKI
jgi:hypothetical protein